MRSGIFFLTLLVGLALAVVALLLASPPPVPMGVVLSQPSSTTGLPFAPVLFILGVMLVFLSAVVYELYPEKRK